MAGDRSATGPETSIDLGTVHIVDSPTQRTHQVSDLVKLAATLMGTALVLFIGAYASGTTAGITQDVQGFYDALKGLLVAPVNILEGAVTMVVPIVVILALAIRREPRRILESLVGLGFGIIAVILAAEGARRWGTTELVDSLSITADGLTDVTMPAYLAGVAGMLTAAGRRRVLRPVAVSWSVLWIAVAVAAISGFVTLPAALSSILIGRSAGLATRFALGSATDRAYGDALVDGIRRAGFEPKRIVRVDPHREFDDSKVDAVSRALGRSRHGRVYEMATIEGHHLMVTALDGDRVAAGSLAKIWRSFRVRGIDSRPDLDLRRAAESTALVSHAARNAGVRTARLLGMAQSRDTMLLVFQKPGKCSAFSDLSPDEASDEVLDSIWAEVQKAHKAGITHRALTSNTVLVCHGEDGEAPTVWLSGWEMGEVASGTFSRSVDGVQLIAMLAGKVGAKRAVDSAFRAMSELEVAALAPFLQTVLLPRPTRIETRARGKVLRDVRAAILDRLPEAPTDPQRITRFSLLKVVTLVLGIVAGFALLATIKPDEVVAAVRGASPIWVLVVAGWTVLTFVGASLALIAFSPVKLPFIRVFLAQVAASFMALAMPAGVGPAIVNLSLLTKRKVTRPLAVATVALVQVSGFIATVIGLVSLSLIAGDSTALSKLPSGSVLMTIAVVAVVVALALAFPRVRAWAASKIMPTVRQTWPRLAGVLARPWSLALGIFGNLLLTASFVGAFYASLRAFGQEPSIISIAILYLLGSAAGAAVPTPGGLGAIELALTTGLVGVGIPAAVAGATVILFRTITYGARIPLGYAAMKYLQKKKEL